MKGTKKLTESINGIYEPRIIMSQINEEKSCFLPQFFVVASAYSPINPFQCISSLFSICAKSSSTAPSI